MNLIVAYQKSITPLKPDVWEVGKRYEITDNHGNLVYGDFYAAHGRQLCFTNCFCGDDYEPGEYFYFPDEIKEAVVVDD